MEGTCHHAKVVEWGAFIIMNVGSHGQWCGAGCCFLIVVVVGAHGGAGYAHHHACGCLWMVVVSPCEGGGVGHAHHGACRCSSTVVGCWSPFVDCGGGGGGVCTCHHGCHLWVFVVGC